MPAVETSIWLALKGRAAELASLLDMAIAWPNEAFTPPTDSDGRTKDYLRVTHIPNANGRLFLGSTAPHRRFGLLQIDVCARKNMPTGVATEIAGKVAAHFPTDLRMENSDVMVKVQRAPDVAQGLPTDTHWMVPVTVRYECFA